MRVFSALCADTDTISHIPRKIRQYDKGWKAYNGIQMPRLFGRTLRYNSRLLPTRHLIYYILANSPLSQLLAQHAYLSLGCCHGIDAYVDFINMMGFHATNLPNDDKDVTERCRKCLFIKSLWTGKSPIQDWIWKQRGPYSQLMNILSPNPMSYFACDETGPFNIKFTDRLFQGIFMLLCVSVVTRKS